MYTKMQLQSDCSTRVDFQHGLAYYNEGRVERIQFEQKKNSEGSIIVEIKSTVKGDHDRYTVRAFVDEVDAETGTGKLMMKYCSCPGSNEEGKICKHCIATLLKYFDVREKSDGDSDSVSMRHDVGEVATSTDTDFLRLLKEHSNKRRIDIRLKNKKDTMRIVPFLTVNDVTLDAQFKAGNDKLYIVKNVASYVQAIKANKTVQFGKNRALLQSFDIFDESSKRILNFLERYEQNRLTHIKSYSAKPENDGRFLTLKNEIIDNFFEAVAGGDVFVDDATSESSDDFDVVEISDEGIRNEYRLFSVKKEKPELSFTVTGLDGNGALITGTFPKIFVGLDNFVFVDRETFFVVPKTELGDAEGFLTYVSKSGCKNIFVSECDLPLFANEMLRILKQYFSVKTVDFDERKYMPEKAVFKFYLDTPKKDTVSCEAIASYEDDKKRFNIFADREYKDTVRNEAEELSMCEELKKYFNKYEPNKKLALLNAGEEEFYDFLTEKVYELGEIGEIFISDKMRGIKIKRASSISAGVSLEGNLLNLTVHSDDFTDAQLTELLTKYSRKKKFFRLTDGTFISVDGENFENLANIARTLKLSGQGLVDGKAEIPKYRALYLDNELTDTPDVKVSRDKDFRALIRNMKTFSDNDFEVPETLKGNLKKYQKYGYRWIKTLKINGFGGILADEMGLGKTLQTIAFLLSEYEEGEKRGTLIVCPASLVYNWKNEFDRFAPSLATVVVAGKQEERVEILNNVNESDVLITSYDLLRRDIELYKQRDFAFQIIDEAQYIKNSSTLSSRAVKRIRAGFKLALTGTPIENRLSELWSVFDYLMPGFLHTYRQFKDEYEVPIVQLKDKGVLYRLQRMIHPFVLRRLKSDVLKDLPEKLEEAVLTKLTPAQNDLYMANWQNVKGKIGKKTSAQIKSEGLQILAELMKLRQICCDPSLLFEGYQGGSAKVELCMDLLKRAIDGGHKILLFSQFTSMLEILEKRLDEEGIEYYSLVGQTPKEKRTQMVEEFNAGTVQVFCISLKAGGTGLNLTSADIVIHFDPWWNVAVQNQATDRAHRIGQKNIVTVYKIIAQGTIEENIMKLQEKKKELASELLTGSEFTEGSFTKEDLLELLG